MVSIVYRANSELEKRVGYLADIADAMLEAYRMKGSDAVLAAALLNDQTIPNYRVMTGLSPHH